MRVLFIIGLSAGLISGCVVTPPVPPVAVTIHDKYRLTSTHENDDFAEPGEAPSSVAALARGGHAGDMFTGTDRRDPKTSVATGDREPYATVAALRSSLMSDSDMLDLGIGKAPDSERVPAEQHNVTVAAVIYAISKESDHDFHLIVGDPECESGDCLMNVEVSGLPPSVSVDYAILKAARSKFLAYFDGTDPGTSGYDKSDPPIPVTITGSLFFDVDHKAGVVGPSGRRPTSAWEIHPLTNIEFSP
jgi:hypothetical protein